MISVENGENGITCPACFTVISSKANFRRHYRIHEQPSAFSCHICGKGFHRQEQLKEHFLAYTSSFNSPIVCPINDCTRIFHEKHDLRVHIKTEHGKEEKEEDIHCKCCGKKSSLKRILIHVFHIHVSIEHIQLIPHSFEEKRPYFPKKTTFPKILNTRAPSNREMTIPWSEDSSEQKQTLVFEQNEKEERPMMILPGNDFFKDKMKKCFFCGIHFPDMVLLSIHMGFHSVENPFRCFLCKDNLENEHFFNLHLALANHSTH